MSPGSLGIFKTSTASSMGYRTFYPLGFTRSLTMGPCRLFPKLLAFLPISSLICRIDYTGSEIPDDVKWISGPRYIYHGKKKPQDDWIFHLLLASTPCDPTSRQVFPSAQRSQALTDNVWSISVGLFLGCCHLTRSLHSPPQNSTNIPWV